MTEIELKTLKYQPFQAKKSMQIVHNVKTLESVERSLKLLANNSLKQLLQILKSVLSKAPCYNSKNSNFIVSLSFLKICSHIFMTFEVKSE